LKRKLYLKNSYPKKLSLFIHPHVIPNLSVFLSSVENNKYVLKTVAYDKNGLTGF